MLIENDFAELRQRLTEDQNSVKPGELAIGPRQDGLIQRVTFVIPRVAQRLPWRADCLVQALAGQHWLRHAGINSHIMLGVPLAPIDRFEAHAWLVAGDRVVTGGDVRDYRPLVPFKR